MEKISDIDLKILAGLLKNSKESDRQLAKAIGVSQPTITRRRARLEKEAISSYTLIPKWVKLGFRLLVITFTKSRISRSSKEKLKEAVDESSEWMMAHPNVIACTGSRGMDMGGFMISLHRDYSEFDHFMRDHNLTLGKYLDNVQNVIVNLDGGLVLKPFDLTYLAEYIDK